ncbi:hypothetical protein [Roseovarius sp. D22-M7]|uniref:hypothetical protein n=1 Tax=Roseovarius sp. D22-M7 TaxID=3127116 RepID=UPI0030104D36
MRVLEPMMTPFIVEATIAYFLDPFACRLDFHGTHRMLRAAVLVLLMMARILAAVVGLLPLLAVKMTGLVRSIPTITPP